MFRLSVFICLIALHFSSSSIAADRCTSLIGSCDYYSCVENERLSCGESGYSLGYGQPYCEKFSATTFLPPHTPVGQALWNSDGNRWVKSVRSCLQEAMDSFMEERSDFSCDDLRSFAFASHPSCYTNSADSFCTMNPESIARVGLIIGPGELLSPDGLAQVQGTAAICVRQLQARIHGEKNLFLRIQLEHYKVAWSLVARDPSQAARMLPTNTKTP